MELEYNKTIGELNACYIILESHIG